MNISIWSIDGTLISTTNPGQSGTKNNGNEEDTCLLLQGKSITIRYNSVLYFEHSLGWGYISAVVYSANSKASAHRTVAKKEKQREMKQSDHLFLFYHLLKSAYTLLMPSYISIDVGWRCWIRRLHFCRGVGPFRNQYTEYSNKLSGVRFQSWSLGNVE